MPTVTLSWDDNNTGGNQESGYEVFRSLVALDPDNPPTPLVTLAADTVTFADTTAAEETDYFYGVRATRGNVSGPFATAFVEVGSGVVIPPFTPFSLPLVNGGAETPGFAGWVNDNNMEYAGSSQKGHITARTGTEFWYAGARAASSMYQDINIDPANYGDIDDGDKLLELTWYQSSFSEDDDAAIYASFFDAGAVLIEAGTPDLMATPDGVWTERKQVQTIPVGARTVRVHMSMVRNSGSQSNGYIDDVLDPVVMLPPDPNAAYRFWRVFMATTGSNGGGAAAEVEIRATAGGSAQTNIVAVTTSTQFGGFSGANVIDGDPATIWASSGATSGHWIMFEFDAPVFCNEVLFQARSGSFADQAIKTGAIQYSADGIALYDAWEVPSQAVWTSNETRLLTRPVGDTVTNTALSFE